MYVQHCAESIVKQLFSDEIANKNLKTRESSDTSLQNFLHTKIANMKDYADAFVRYMRATELVTFQRKTLRLVISSQKVEKVDYILKTISPQVEKFKTESDFKNYLFSPFSVKLLR